MHGRAVRPSMGVLTPGNSGGDIANETESALLTSGCNCLAQSLVANESTRNEELYATTKNAVSVSAACFMLCSVVNVSFLVW